MHGFGRLILRVRRLPSETLLVVERGELEHDLRGSRALRDIRSEATASLRTLHNAYWDPDRSAGTVFSVVMSSFLWLMVCIAAELTASGRAEASMPFLGSLAMTILFAAVWAAFTWDVIGGIARGSDRLVDGIVAWDAIAVATGADYTAQRRGRIRAHQVSVGVVASVGTLVGIALVIGGFVSPRVEWIGAGAGIAPLSALTAAAAWRRTARLARLDPDPATRRSAAGRHLRERRDVRAPRSR